MVDLDREVEQGRIMNTAQLERVEYTALLTPDMLVEGEKNRVVNAVALASDDETVYLTVSSTRFQLSDSLFEIMSDASGRVVRYNLRTKEIVVLVNNINFANGIALSAGEDYLLFCETGRLRLHKHFLTGEKAGQTEVLADNLPGMPDNIR